MDEDYLESRKQKFPAVERSVSEGSVPEVGITLHCNILEMGVGKAMKTCSDTSVAAVLCAQKGGIFFFFFFFLRDFIFKKTLFEKLQYLKQEQ